MTATTNPETPSLGREHGRGSVMSSSRSDELEPLVEIARAALKQMEEAEKNRVTLSTQQVTKKDQQASDSSIAEGMYPKTDPYLEAMNGTAPEPGHSGSATLSRSIGVDPGSKASTERTAADMEAAQTLLLFSRAAVVFPLGDSTTRQSHTSTAGDVTPPRPTAPRRPSWSPLTPANRENSRAPAYSPLTSPAHPKPTSYPYGIGHAEINEPGISEQEKRRRIGIWKVAEDKPQPREFYYELVGNVG